MNHKAKGIIGAALLSIGTFAAGAVSTSAAHAQFAPALQFSPMRRGDERGDRNLLAVRQRLENLIDQLQRDPRDYDGHRVAAINNLQHARYELDAAVSYEERHDH